MPKISIFEKDLTNPATVELSDNIVYVPGYAVMGPVNTPTLCTSVDDFESIFGTLPYTFLNTYSYPTSFDTSAKSSGSFVVKDEYEKSYIYAIELLKNGLPVYYERVMSEAKIAAFQASKSFVFTASTEGTDTFNILAKNPGRYGTSITYSISKLDTSKYSLVVTITKGNAIPETVTETLIISFDTSSEYYYANVTSDLVTLTITGTIPVAEDIVLTIPEGEASGNLALPSTTLSTTDEFVPQEMYDRMNDTIYTTIEDKSTYNIKFITSGAYPTFEYNSNSVVIKMLQSAGIRGDALAVIDHTNVINRVLTGNNSVYNSLQNLNSVIVGEGTKQEDARKYGAMFTPYAIYNSTVLNKKVILPASFAYLNSLAESVKTYENWYAVAGVTRGLVPNFVQPIQVITGAICDKYQTESAISINPVIYVNSYGYCIWGNRTLNKDTDLVASSFLNIRSISNDVKKLVYKTAQALTFELNSDILWLTFRSKIEPTLDKMVSGNGLSNYKLIKKTSTKKATIEAIIRLYAIEAVENWDITIELADNYVSVE